MPPPSDHLLSLLTIAADLRAAGVSWAAVGERVSRSDETCRAWPRRYPDDWRRLSREAEDLLTAEAGGEARIVLRKLLRSENEKVSLAAANLLLRARDERRACEERREDAAARAPADAAEAA